MDAKAQFRSLAEPWADTGTSTGRLMIAVLGGLADVERDLIRTRTAEGRSRAQKRGQHMGRPPKLTPAQQAEARRPAGAGRYARRTCAQLPRRQEYDFTADYVNRCGLAEKKRIIMSIDPHARKILDQYGIEVVRAKYIKEIAVTGDTEGELNKEIAFGNDKVRLRDIAKWLGAAAKKRNLFSVLGYLQRQAGLQLHVTTGPA